MPYKSGEIPAGTKKLPAHGQSIYRSAFNAAFNEYGEERAHAIAWAAVKHKYKKKEGRWVTKDGYEALRYFDEGPGHPFRGNQHTGGISGEQGELPLTGGGMKHTKDVKKFLSGPRVKQALKSVVKHAIATGEHHLKDEAIGALKSVVAIGLVALGASTAPAIAGSIVAGYAIGKLADKLGIDAKGAHKLLKSAVSKLKDAYEEFHSPVGYAASMMQGSHPRFHQPLAFDADEKEDPIARALRELEEALNSHTTEELVEEGKKFKPGKKIEDEEAGHPFRGNQYTTGESGGGEKEGGEKGGKGEGESEHPGKGYSKEATLDKNGTIQTSNVSDAIRALYENRKVELSQTRQVSTLIDKLGEVAQRMERRGFKGNFDLCNVSVKGSNLFCEESHGIPRIQMPQLKGKPSEGSIASKQTPDKRGEVDMTGAFMKHLGDKGYKITRTMEDVAYMKATQDELKGSTVAILAKAYRAGKLDVTSPMVLSRDNYILDGHHRWAAMIGVAASEGKLKGLKIEADRVDIGTIHLLQEARRFAAKVGLPQVGVAQSKATKDRIMKLLDKTKCSHCDGTGMDEDGDECEWCDGDGYIDDDNIGDSAELTSTLQLTDNSLSIIDGKVRKTNDGYLVADARIARTGIQIYGGNELGVPHMKEVRVYRPPSEVFSKAAIRSLANLPVTLSHPPEMVDAANWDKYAVGHLGEEPLRDGDSVRVPLIVMDAKAIEAYEKHGVKELSVGYSTDLKWGRGRTPAGEIYDAKQTAIRGNHLAVVPAARGGSLLRIGDDTGEPEMVKILIDGQTIEFDDGLKAKHVETYIGTLQKKLTDAEFAFGKKKAEEEQEEEKKTRAEKDAAEMKGEIVALKKQLEDANTKLSDAAVDKMIEERIDLRMKAHAAMDGKIDFTGKSPVEIRRTVVDAKMGEAAKTLSDLEVIGAFKALTADIKPRAGVDRLADSLSMLQQGGGSTAANNPNAIREAAYNEYVKRITNDWKPRAAS